MMLMLSSLPSSSRLIFHESTFLTPPPSSFGRMYRQHLHPVDLLTSFFSDAEVISRHRMIRVYPTLLLYQHVPPKLLPLLKLFSSPPSGIYRFCVVHAHWYHAHCFFARNLPSTASHPQPNCPRALAQNRVKLNAKRPTATQLYHMWDLLSHRHDIGEELLMSRGRVGRKAKHFLVV